MNAPATVQSAAQVVAPTAAELVTPSPEFQRLLESTYSPRTALQGDNMEKMFRLAETLASGKTTVPKHLQGNVGDCMAVVTQAMQWNMNAFAVAQKTHIVNGALGYEAQLVVAVLNSSPALATRISYEWYGTWSGVQGKTDKSNERGVRVSAVLIGEKEARVLDVSMAQVGNVRNSPLWESDPRQQIAYLCAKRWGRLHAPDVLLGVYTPDELEEIEDRRDRPKTAAQFGEAARPAVVETDDRAALIQRLEAKAAEGGDVLAHEWGKALSKEQRKLVGPQEIERIKGLVPKPETKPEPPTYAVLMDRLHAATSADAINLVGAESGHLPADQRDEIGGACREALGKLNVEGGK